jgi:predicted restriction endonuclease
VKKAELKRLRVQFREAVLKRDGYRCKVCGEAGTEESLDAHHITNRNELPNGGYCPENGITLCKKAGGCHEKAESSLKYQHNLLFDGPITDSLDTVEVHRVYAPYNLYELIGSSLEQAVEAARKLGTDEG